ncbi:hypothetical protein E2542_SST18645 [Spatholobus suberectus]|nr:hypothetical protein E2542_SST18645 [Spatholobus suberectus]
MMIMLSNLHVHRDIILEIRDLMSRDWSVTIAHVHHDSNCVADHLAVRHFLSYFIVEAFCPSAKIVTGLNIGNLKLGPT